MQRAVAVTMGSALLALSTATLRAQAAPPEPYVREGACPLECCTYGEWTAERRLRAYADRGDTSSVAFVVPPGRRFTALGGGVVITRPGVVEIREPLHRSWLQKAAGKSPRFRPGDTVYVLDYLGEGAYRVWHRGEVVQAEDHWWSESEIREEDPDEVRAVQHVEPRSEWWVEIADGRGRRGWLLMEEAAVTGADACS